MSQRKFDRACQLYLALGQLDDATASGALNYRKRISSGVRVAIILAACMAFIVTMIVGVSVVSRVGNDNKSKFPDDAAPQTVSAVLEAKRDEYRTYSEDEIDLFDGKVTLIWKYADRDGYCKKTFSEAQRRKLVSNIGKGTVTGNTSQKTECYVWVSFGDGTVVSPCLSESSGNIGYGTLFEYEPEIEPSADITSYIRTLLG